MSTFHPCKSCGKQTKNQYRVYFYPLTETDETDYGFYINLCNLDCKKKFLQELCNFLGKKL